MIFVERERGDNTFIEYASAITLGLNIISLVTILRVRLIEYTRLIMLNRVY